MSRLRSALAVAGGAGLTALAAWAGAMSAQAQPAGPPPGLTPAAAARLPACAACHDGAAAATGPPAPLLAAQPRTFLENRLVTIREGLSPVPTMKGLLDGLDDADLVALARHYAALPPPAPAATGAFDPARAARGAALSQRALCGSCHLPDYRGQDGVPRLAAQREAYLLQSLRDFAAGRAAGRDTAMSNALLGLSDADLQDLAHHLAHVRPGGAAAR